MGSILGVALAIGMALTFICGWCAACSVYGIWESDPEE